MSTPRSWLASAQDSPFGVHNLPYGVFTAADRPGRRRIGVRVGEFVLDAGAAARAAGEPSALLDAESLNPLLGAGRPVWTEVRAALTRWLTDESYRAALSPLLLPLAEVELHLPFEVADYVDFYASELSGVLVVQGGPGTGKTVVALHRAAYLLYTHRDRLAKRGVLVIGPNRTFLRYIDQVLPALGESEVVLSSIGALYPGVTGTDTETPEAAAVKGDARMARVLATALEGLRQLPEEEEPWTITVGRSSPHQEELVIGRALCERAHAAAHRTGEPHNAARAALVERLSSELALRIARDRGGEMALDDVVDLADALVVERDFQALAEKLWPLLGPEQLLTALFASPQLLADAMPDFSEAERAALLRERPGPDEPAAPWTTDDVPLLDEAAELAAGAGAKAVLHSIDEARAEL
ncbi:hypothetical protein ACFVXQ_08015 [Kitasatospora sp. NPDC058263]